MLRSLRQMIIKPSLAFPRARGVPTYQYPAQFSRTTVAASASLKAALARLPTRRAFGTSDFQKPRKSSPLYPSGWDPRDHHHKRGCYKCFALCWLFTIFVLASYSRDLAPLTGRIRWLAPLPMLRGPAVNDPEQASLDPDAKTLPDDDARVQRLQDVIERMTYAAGLGREEWTIALLDSEAFACSVVGSTHRVMMTTGLIKAADSDAALAFILGRELARVVARHDVDVARPMGITIFVALGTWPYFGYLSHLAWHGATALPGPATVLAAGGFLVLLSDWAIVGQGLCQERRDEEADYIGLVLMTSAGYNTEELDIFVPATGLSNWHCTIAGSGRILQGLVQKHVKSDMQRIEKLVRLAPFVREFVQAYNGPSRLRDIQPKSVPHRWLSACWDKFVREREKNRSREASSS